MFYNQMLESCHCYFLLGELALQKELFREYREKSSSEHFRVFKAK